MNEKCKEYDELSDIFEYGNMSDEEVLECCNQILMRSKDEKNEMVLEAMFHAIFTAMNCRDIGNKVDIDSILDYIYDYNEEISDYIISILAYTGNQEYISIIRKIGVKYENLDIVEAIEELESRN